MRMFLWGLKLRCKTRDVGKIFDDFCDLYLRERKYNEVEQSKKIVDKYKRRERRVYRNYVLDVVIKITVTKKQSEIGLFRLRNTWVTLNDRHFRTESSLRSKNDGCERKSDCRLSFDWKKSEIVEPDRR